MRRPDPAQLRVLFETTANLGVVERVAPADLINLELESLARGVVDEAVAELAVADDEAGLFQQRELGADGVIREAA